MTLNRLITTAIQLALLGVVSALVYAIYYDVKSGGLND